MSAQGPRLTPELVRYHLRQRKTMAEIGRIYAVSRQYVSTLAKQLDGDEERPARFRAMKHYPISSGRKYNGTYYDKRLRDLLEFNYTGGKISMEKRVQLRGFVNRLINENLIVVFNPETGFELKSRLRRDGYLALRENSYTSYDAKARLLMAIDGIVV